MTLTQLRYFAAIADAGLNITVAAERLHATQPGLSKQLKLLEEGLGFRLFTRRGRALEALTPSGQDVLVHARRILLEAGNIRSYAANARAESEGKLVLITTPTQARYVLPHPISALKSKHPNVSVHLLASEENEVQRRLVAEQADLAIMSTSGAPPEAGLAIPLYRWKRVAVVPRTHPLASVKGTLSLARLSEFPLISYESSNRSDSSLRLAFQAAGLPLTIAITTPEADLIKTYARAGLGVGIVSEISLNPATDHDLRVLSLPSAISDCICWAVLPRDQLLRAYVLDLLCDIAPQLDRVDIKRALSGVAEYHAASPPSWLELTQQFSI